MNFLELKRLTSRMLIAASFCVLLANCGNKSALFLNSVEDAETKVSSVNNGSDSKESADKTETVQTNKSGSDKDKKSNGEQQP